ncbi:MAG: hypothetical protein AAFN92_12945, partial [Bacteroidota bacterium]
FAEGNAGGKSVETPAGGSDGSTTPGHGTGGGLDGFASRIPFSESANVITVRVWSPTAGTPFLLKAEKTDDATISVETLTSTTVAMAWDTLTFDFRNEADGTAAINYNNVYGKLSIFPNFGTSPTADETYYFDDVVFTGETGDGGGPQAPMTAAPTPTQDAADVISIFSGAYDDVVVDTYLTVWSQSGLTDTVAVGDSVLRYDNLSFAGIEVIANPIDLVAAEMTHLHVDYWSPNAMTFRMKLVDFGGTGPDPTDDNTEVEIPRDLAQGEWVSVDYPLTAFAGMNLNDINQFVISAAPAGAATVYLDNIYFYKGVILGSQMDLPVTFDEADVDYGLAGFGGVDPAIVTDPTDATNTVGQAIKTAGAMTWGGTTMTSTNGGPDGFASRIPFSASANVITVRVWSPTAGTPFLLKAEKTDDPTISVETLASTTVAMAWDTLTFDFRNQADGTAAINYDNVYGKLSIFPNFGTSPAADETYYFDDVVFTGTNGSDTGGGDVPMTAAPAPPARDAADVISLFSHVYDNLPVDTWRTDWSNADFADITIEDNATKHYTNLTFVGIETIGSPLNLEAGGMTHFHVDYWTPNMDTVRFKLVDFGMDGFQGDNGDTENEQVFMTTKGEWVSLDIPLADFSGMDQTDINQLVISGLPAGTGTL